MRLRNVVVVLAVGVLFSVPSWAGNKVLMEKEGKELVSINEQVIKELPNVQNNSRVKLEANVVQRDGKTEVHIDHISFGPSVNTSRSTARTGHKVEHVPASTKDAKVSTGGAAAEGPEKAPVLTTDEMKAKLDQLKAAHPDAHFVELDAKDVHLSGPKSHTKAKRVFVAAWGD